MKGPLRTVTSFSMVVEANCIANSCINKYMPGAQIGERDHVNAAIAPRLCQALHMSEILLKSVLMPIYNGK